MVEVPREVTHELAPLENVLWAGQPRKGLILRGYDAFALPFGLIWLGAVVGIFSSLLKTPRQVDPIGILFAIIFVAAGLYLVAGRFFVEAKQRSRTFYAVSTE